jgi:hypothetical protein
MAGNTDRTNSSDRVLTVDRYDLTQQVPYFDMFDGRVTMNGQLKFKKSPLLPFVDEILPRNVASSSSYDTIMFRALAALSGSTENYVSSKYKSATAGIDYDNNSSIGTDSITFGGMVY